MKYRINHLFDILKAHKFLTSCVCTIVVFLFYFALNSCKFVYASYDDYPFVVFLTHGDDTFLYLGVLLSKFLYFFQRLLPSVSVYPLFLVISSIFSFVVLNYVLLKRFSVKIGLVVSFLFNLIFIFITVICLQYTEIAGLISLASSSTIISAILFEERKRYKITQIIIGVFLAIIGSQVRFEAYLPCGVFSVLFCFSFFIKTYFSVTPKKRKISFALKKSLGLTIAIILVLVSVFSVNTASNYIKKSSGLSAHLAYTDARTKVQDYQIALYEGNESFYRSQDVYSKDDFVLLTCFKSDKDVYTTEKMNAIAQYAVEHNTGKTNIYYQYYLAIKNKVAGIFGNSIFVYPIIAVILIAGIALLALLFRLRNRIKWVFFIALIVVWIAFAVYIKSRHNILNDTLLLLFLFITLIISVVGNRFQFFNVIVFTAVLIVIINYMVFTRLPFRAEYTVVVPAIYFLIFLFNTADVRCGLRNYLSHTPIALRTILVSCISVMLVIAMQFGLGVSEITAQESKYDADLVSFMNSHSDSVFFYDCYGCDLIDHAKYNPFALPDFPKNSIQYGGWPAASFFYDRQLNDFGIKKLYKEMINNNKRFFVITKDDVIDGRHYLDRMISYYNSHYRNNKEIVFNKVYSSERAWVYQVIEQ